MKRSALAIRSLILSIASAFGVEGAWLIAAAIFLSVGCALLIDPRAPWFVLGILSLVAFLSLTRRTT